MSESCRINRPINQTRKRAEKSRLISSTFDTKCAGFTYQMPRQFLLTINTEFMETRKTNYEAPKVEILEIEIEQAVLVTGSSTGEGGEEENW